MMEAISNSSGKVYQWVKDKYSHEFQLAKNILAEFNKPAILGELRRICKQSTVLLEWVQDADPSDFEKNHKKDLSTYGCFTKHGIKTWSPLSILRSKISENWDASDCGDFIRVFGEIFEKNPKYRGYVTDKNINQQRLEPQKGGADHWAKAGLRDRSLKLPGPELSDIHTALRAIPGEHGILRWQQGDRDTCGKLDKLFGLCPGATISGTTTDNIFFFDKFSRGGVDSLMYLLPMAAIVGNGHHTTIEVALPLSLNNKMDYVVGLYSTLMPKPTLKPTRSPAMLEAASAIEDILEIYEKSPFNRLMVLSYTKDGKIENCHLFDQKNAADRKAWTKFALCSQAMMDFTRTVQPNPNFLNAQVLMGKRFSK